MIVTLTTDFGTRDPYVAAMKGVILSRCPEARIVDLGHEIAPQAVMEASLFLAQAAPGFPAGTIHVVVVDPGVGTGRRPVAASCGRQIYVCPDNGLLTMVCRDQEMAGAWVIAESRFLADEVSATFHGRDIFAPAGAALACGTSPDELGPVAGDLLQLEIPTPTMKDGQVDGLIIHVDRFGNLLTNITRQTQGALSCSGMVVGGACYGPVRRTYADVPPGQPVVLWSSSGFLELAVREGDASARLNVDVGDSVRLEPAGDSPRAYLQR